MNFFTINRWTAVFNAIGALLIALAPWNSGPYWLDVIGIFICTFLVQLVLIGMQKLFNYCYKRWFQSK